jgi:opacity protein-like surface antigen
MNKTIKWIAIGVNVCALKAVAAQPPACPWYLQVGAGPAFMQDVEDRNSSAKAAFNVGARFDVGLGYTINEHWSADFETGTIYSSLKDNSNVKFYQIPFIVDGIYKFPLKSAFTPYIGAGAGGVATRLSMDTAGSDTDFAFAYQAQAGVTYSLSQNASIGLGYKFFGTTDHEWTTAITTKTKGLYTHSVILSFNWAF